MKSHFTLGGVKKFLLWHQQFRGAQIAEPLKLICFLGVFRV